MRVIIFLAIVSLPVVTFAANGLVPCGGANQPQCDACHVIQLGQNILRFLIVVTIPIIGIVFVWAGMRLVMSAGNSSEVTAAKSLFTNAIIGLIILLSAWLIIDTIMKLPGFINDSKLGPWNEIQCVGQPTAGTGSTGTQTGQYSYSGYIYDDANQCRQAVSSFGAFDTVADCKSDQSLNNPQTVFIAQDCDGSSSAAGPAWLNLPDCAGGSIALTNTPSGTTGCAGSCYTIDPGIQVKSGACSGSAPCTVSSQIADSLSLLNQNLQNAGISSSDWRITEAYPPTVTHQASCHSDGTCVDANFTGTFTPDDIDTFVTQANASGLRAVFEVGTQAEYDLFIQGGVSPSNIILLPPINGVPQITAHHFSIYAN